MLFQLCASGAHLSRVELVILHTGGAASGQPKPFVVLAFSPVFVQNISWSASGGDNNVQETINLEYGQVQLRYLNTQSNAASSSSWSQVTNSAGPPLSA